MNKRNKATLRGAENENNSIQMAADQTISTYARTFIDKIAEKN